jgi:hypothetical protein
MADILRDEFPDLAPWAAQWALPTENERSVQRWRASKSDFDGFYTAMLPRLPAVLTRLGAISTKTIPPEARSLLYLAMAFAEASPHVEMYRGSAKVPHSFDAARFAAAHGDAVP